MRIPPDTPGWGFVGTVMAPLVGTVVRIREWDSMAKEYRSGPDGISCGRYFGTSMRELCGKTYTVQKVSRDPRKLIGWRGTGEEYYVQVWFEETKEYNFSTHMIEPLRLVLSPVEMFVQRLHSEKILTAKEV